MQKFWKMWNFLLTWICLTCVLQNFNKSFFQCETLLRFVNTNFYMYSFIYNVWLLTKHRISFKNEEERKLEALRLSKTEDSTKEEKKKPDKEARYAPFSFEDDPGSNNSGFYELQVCCFFLLVNSLLFGLWKRPLWFRCT